MFIGIGYCSKLFFLAFLSHDSYYYFSKQACARLSVVGDERKRARVRQKASEDEGSPLLFLSLFFLVPNYREPGTVISLNFLSPDHVILEDRQSFATNLMRASPTQISTWLSVNKLSAAGSFREYWMQMNCIVLPFYLVLFILQLSIVCCLFCPILLYFERGTVLDS